MRINADDDASIDVYTKDGKTKLCTVNCFDLGSEDAGRLRACIDVIPAARLKANALVFHFRAEDKEPEHTNGNGRHRLSSNGLVAVEIRT
jgi:hypothetical protein